MTVADWLKLEDDATAAWLQLGDALNAYFTAAAADDGVREARDAVGLALTAMRLRLHAAYDEGPVARPLDPAPS